MENDMQVLLEQYKVLYNSKPTSFQLAEAEHNLWRVYNIVNPGRLEGDVIRTWLKRTINLDVEHAYEVRHSLYMHRAWAMPLFEQVDLNKVSLSTAIRLMQKVTRYAKLHERERGEVLLQFLQNYNGTPASLSPVAPTVTSVEKLDAVSNNVQMSVQFQQQVKMLGAVYIEHLLAEVPDGSHHRRELLEGFDLSLGQLVEELRDSVNRIKQVARRIKADNRVTRKAFTWACEVLGISFKYEHPEELDMKRVSRAKLRRARDLHPDRNPAPEAVDEYQAVLEAYKVLEAYSKEKR